MRRLQWRTKYQMISMKSKQSQSISLTENHSKGFPQHCKKAIRSTEEENSMAIAKIGSTYEKGLGVFKDYVKAYMWYFIAEHKGNRQAALDRERIAIKMTPAQIDKAQAMAHKCLPHASLCY